MLLVYAEAFSMIRLKIIVVTSHVVGGKGSFTQLTTCQKESWRSPCPSVTLFSSSYFFLLENVIYMLVTNNQPPVLISKIFRQVIHFIRYPTYCMVLRSPDVM